MNEHGGWDAGEDGEAPPLPHFVLKLYVAGHTPRSTRALANLKRICAEHLDGRYQLEVIDLYQQPERAMEDQIVALPTLVKDLPEPPCRIIGDLSDTEKVLAVLDLKPA